MSNYKKIVLVLVEGPADDEALAMPLNAIFDTSEVHVEIIHGDITSEFGNDASTIVSAVTDVVQNYLSNNFFQNTDIAEIIHITDTDGTYVPQTSIVSDSSAKEFIYSEESIRANNIRKVIARNDQKSQCINQLVRTSKILKIRYRIFYMSCNLDHVLFNQLNLTDKEKERLSQKFAENCEKGVIDFKSFILNPEISVSGNYRDTWSFIRRENNSLHRHTNLGICFPE